MNRLRNPTENIWNYFPPKMKRSLGVVALGSSLLLYGCTGGDDNYSEPSPTPEFRATPIIEFDPELDCPIIGKADLDRDSPDCVIEPQS